MASPLPRRLFLPPLLALAALLVSLLTVPSAGAAQDEFTPVAASVLATPEPVLGGDGRQHLAYELLLINQSDRATATVRSIRALAGGKVVGSLAGAALATAMKPLGQEKGGVRLGRGEAATVLMDLSFPRGARLPRRLVHRIAIAQRPPSPVVATAYLAAPTPVSRRPAIVVAPPLRGPGWVVGNGCCAEPTSHRASVLAINGALHAGERFAIDFIQVAPNGRIVEGPWERLSSYPFFGAGVFSSTAGRVVTVVDGLPETQPQLELPPGTAADAGGNHVVVAMGGDRFAFYGHLQPGSITVAVGDRVRVGQPLGRLGSSGNSNAPHLHFQLMDGPLPLAASGVPYRFSRFSAEGTLANFVPFFIGQPAQIAPKPVGPRRGELPLNRQVVGFD
ncbi:MAG TPA: M23 family metallopeptidase [Solirubrobacterales bacterium]|nr:M23 family metallopeptidase [Solirubrobacterales bacterium]